jgi:hypothetical protein
MEIRQSGATVDDEEHDVNPTATRVLRDLIGTAQTGQWCLTGF